MSVEKPRAGVCVIQKRIGEKTPKEYGRRKAMRKEWKYHSTKSRDASRKQHKWAKQQRRNVR